MNKIISELSQSVDYTLAQLARLDLCIRREVLQLRLHLGQRVDEAYRGLYVSDAEVDQLLDGSLMPAQLLMPHRITNDELEKLDEVIKAVTYQLEELEMSYEQGNGMPRMLLLAQSFGLTKLESEIILLCLAAEFDLKYERLFAYLQDDNTKKRPTIDLVMRLLCQSVEERLIVRRCFEPESPLMKWELVSLHDDPNARRSVLPARYLKLDERITNYLLGSDQLDWRLATFVVTSLANNTLAPSLVQQFTRWRTNWEQSWSEQQPVALFQGRYGVGASTAARVLAEQLHRPMLSFNAAELVTTEGNFRQTLKLVEREARLSKAVLVWAEADTLLQPGANETHRRAFIQALAQGEVLTILLAEKSWEPAGCLGQRPFLRLEIPEPSYIERQATWTSVLNGSRAQFSERELETLVSRFRLNTGQIGDALSRARTLAWLRDPSNGHYPTMHDLETACRMQAQPHLGALARKLEPRYGWHDIVLPPSQLATLRQVATTVRHRATVYGEWGFDKKLANGKGLIALFAGPSGTGKTMAAEIIAGELGLDLYRIDLSAVVNKYIGETEKNLERIFSEAQDSNAILFFDEADALFGKRSEAKDAHDRYANIETAYLLQRTEEYTGLVILASNLKNNMDEAFVRRLHFALDFPMPEEEERLAIWERTFPPEAPRDEELDLAFLARRFKFSGGNIRNIILAGAFLAAEDGEPIGMAHLVRAVSYELQKMGKLVVEGEFEHYFEHTLV